MSDHHPAEHEVLVHEHVRRWELLLEVGLDLHAERNFDRLLEKILHRLTEIMDAERSSLFLLDEEKGELWSKVAQRSEEIGFPTGVGIAGQVARKGEILNIADAYQDSRFNPEFDRRSGYQTRTLLTAPLKTSSAPRRWSRSRLCPGSLLSVVGSIESRKRPRPPVDSVASPTSGPYDLPGWMQMEAGTLEPGPRSGKSEPW